MRRDPRDDPERCRWAEQAKLVERLLAASDDQVEQGEHELAELLREAAQALDS